MSTINEQIVTGRAHRVLIDKVAKLWQRISFWTKASDVEFNDGNTAETKVGAIKGITTDLNTTETGYAADMTALAQLNSDIENNCTVRYDAQLDLIQIYNGNAWTDWKIAGLSWGGLIYKNGVFSEKYFSPITYNSHITGIGISILGTLQFYAHAEQKQSINGGLIICFNKTPLNLKYWNWLNVKSFVNEYTIQKNTYYGFGFDENNALTDYNLLTYKFVGSGSQGNKDDKVNLGAITDQKEYYLYIFFGGAFTGGSDYGISTMLQINEIKLSS